MYSSSKSAQKLIEAVAQLGAEDYNAFKSAFIDLTNYKRQQAVRSFKVGQLVEFKGRFNNKIVARVTKLGPKNLKAVEVKVNGIPPQLPRQWRVSPTFCTAVA